MLKLVGICNVSKIEHLTLLIIEIDISSFNKQVFVFIVVLFSALYSDCFCISVELFLLQRGKDYIRIDIHMDDQQ